MIKRNLLTLKKPKLVKLGNVKAIQARQKELSLKQTVVVSYIQGASYVLRNG